MHRPTAWPGVLIVALVLTVLVSPAASQVTTITYQGVLKDAGSPITATDARLSFRLWDAETGGTQIGSDYVAYPVDVDTGIFTTQLDFGLTPFEDGAARWLEIGVDATGGTSYTWLSPRQPITAVPMALHAANAGDSHWTISGSATVIMGHNVGIGTDTPTSPLEVVLDDNWPAGDLPAIKVTQDYCDGDEGHPIHATLSCPLGAAVYGSAEDPSGESYGVYGRSASSSGAGVMGWTTNEYGTSVFGSTNYGTARAIYGRNAGATGDAIAVQGYSPNGFAGYFEGKGYFQGRLGIGTTTPSNELDVAGTIRTDGFILSTTPTAGHVLTAGSTGIGTWQAPATGSCLWHEGPGDLIYYTDGNVGIGTPTPSFDFEVQGTSYFSIIQVSQLIGGHLWPQTFRLGSSALEGNVLTTDEFGNATWQLPDPGFELPYDGTVAAGGAAFEVTNEANLGTSNAIEGIITHSICDGAAGYFDARGTAGYGLKAYSDGADAFYASQSGAVGYAVNAWTTTGPAAGRFSGGLTGGAAAEFAFTGASGSGIEVNATGANARGVHVTTSGTYGEGLLVQSTGAESYAAIIESPWVGLVAKGGIAGAKIYGDLDLYEYGTSNKVLELGKGLDYAEGFDVTGGERGASPGCVLVIDANQPGQLTLSRKAYDRRVAGIVAGANSLGSGVRLGGDGFDHDVALAGRVYCNVIATDGPVEPGDLLTTSDVPGYAMKAADHARATGAILGKAMEPLAAGERGQILVLVTLQ